jgi:hypothetical protein
LLFAAVCHQYQHTAVSLQFEYHHYQQAVLSSQFDSVFVLTIHQRRRKKRRNSSRKTVGKNSPLVVASAGLLLGPAILLEVAVGMVALLQLLLSLLLQPLQLAVPALPLRTTYEMVKGRASLKMDSVLMALLLP